MVPRTPAQGRRVVINRLLYVSCDDCGVPVGTADNMTATVKGARLMAKSFDFIRVRINGKLRDRCPKCAERAALNTGSSATAIKIEESDV
jgi:hypothetical protein